MQKEVAELAKRNIVLNNLENRLQIKNINIKDFEEKEEYDACVTNPPYKENGTGIKNEADTKVIARHEVLARTRRFYKNSK